MTASTRTLLVLAALAGAAPGGGLAAQRVLEQFSYQNLRPSGLQVDLGPLGADDLLGTLTGGVRVDYGLVAPKVRVLLGLSYFRGEFDGRARARFEQRLRNLVIDPSGDDTIRVGRIYWSDLTADLDLQYVLPQGRSVTAYLGAGVGAHLRNGSGNAINGTFVEDALDGIAAAFNLSLGVEFHVSHAWRLTLDGRGVVSPDLSTVSLRGGVMYRIEGAR